MIRPVPLNGFNYVNIYLKNGVQYLKMNVPEDFIFGSNTGVLFWTKENVLTVIPFSEIERMEWVYEEAEK